MIYELSAVYMSRCAHHYSSEKADAASTVSVRHHVSITNGQESDRDHPQGLHVVATEVSVVVVSEGIKRTLRI